MNQDRYKSDLHCHSVFSDGTCTPQELLLLAKEKNFKGLSITDHDTVLAYEEAIPIAKELGISLISGVEFSTQHEGQNVHVLGYSFPVDDPHIKELCLSHEERRRDRNLEILGKLRKKGFDISERELSAAAGNIGSVGRPHIAQVLVDKGYISKISDAFKNLIGDGQCCYVVGKYPTTEETLAIIHQAKGVAVLAHPHLMRDKYKDLFPRLKDLPFDGIEAYYAYFPLHVQEKWIKIAKEKGWLITGGSDFHGTIKPETSLGCSWTPEETFDILLELYEKNSK